MLIPCGRWSSGRSSGSGEGKDHSVLGLLQARLVLLLGQLNINAGALLKTTTLEWGI
ncbi:hypothetical protein DPMN_002233 [Dreissena polymorpha]|uniref:Uncharacterized protein n=1 Tax=Dreissena polymorpha TaxID=45954 RepID=A0A9D4MJA6_DREPO|nr:hypothetical protein DPMN_002233 [Dreissena polymorpha]